MIKYNKKSQYRQNKNGYFVSVLYALVLLAATVMSSLAVDLSHDVEVRNELQAAVDAAALAGAQQLTVQSPTANQLQQAQTVAINIAANNTADGIAVSNQAPTTVTVVSDTGSNGASNVNLVTVTATRTINTIFAPLLNINVLPIGVTATAQASRGLSTINPNQLTAIAVSLNYQPSAGPEANSALDTITPGQSFTIDLNNNEANGCLIRSLGTTDTSYLSASIALGNTQVQSSGGAGASQWAAMMSNGTMQVGDILNMALMMGAPPGSQ